MLRERVRVTQENIFEYPVANEPKPQEKPERTSYPYDARGIITRIFFLIDPTDLYHRDIILELHERATQGTEYPSVPLEIGAAVWRDPNALVSRLLETEGTRIAEPEPWQNAKKILLTIF